MSWDTDQTVIGRTILSVVRSLGLSPDDTQRASVAAISAALAESDLKNVNYGDRPASMGGQMSSSRGIFQQLDAWGPLSDRLDVTKATRMFLMGGQAGQRGLLDVPGWNTLTPWEAAQAVQGSEFSDGSNYRARYNSALEFIKSFGGSDLPPADAVTVGYSNGTARGQSVGIFDGVQAMVLTFALKSLFTLTGLGLVVLGTWRMSAPVRRGAAKVASTVPAGRTAAAATS